MTSPAPDPYDPPPSFWRGRSDYLWAGLVFVLTVVLTVGSFPPFHAPEFAYALAAPAVFWAYTRPRFKLFAWTLFAAQAVTWTILLGWLHHVTWLGLFLLGPFVGAWVGSWYLAVWWTMPRFIGRSIPERLLAQLGLAGLWVVIEWSRTWLLGGFPWLPLAASQWQVPSILQIAPYTGAWGVSFVLIVVNIGFAAYLHRLLCEGPALVRRQNRQLSPGEPLVEPVLLRDWGLSRRSQEFWLALFLLLICLSVHVQETLNRHPYIEPFARVALVQPDIPQEIKWDPSKGADIVKVLAGTTLAAARTRPDLILWPESTTPWAVKGNDDMRALVESLATRAQTPLLLGSIAIEKNPAGGSPGQEETDYRWYNAAFVVTPDTGLQPAYYAKRHLVPFGEFVPFRPVLGWLKKFVPIGDGDFQPGSDAAPLVISLRNGVAAFGVLICYEDIYPQLARESVLSGADVLTVLSNNAWFGQGGVAEQHAAHSVLRAVETRRPVLRCSNGGWSGWIDEFGGIRYTMTDDDGSVYFRGARTIAVTHDVRWVGRSTFYVQHGDWFVLVCAGLALFAYALVRGRTAKL